MVLRQSIMLAVLIFFAQTAAAETTKQASDCSNVEECISILSDHEIDPPPPPGARRSSGINPRPIEKAVNRLISFGDEAVIALIKLFDHQNYNVRNRAGYTLFHFIEIDPRHLPSLIAAHKSGIHWLEPAIAATGTDEALTFLWEGFLNDPDQASNSQVFRVLPKFGDRLLPYVREELEKCQRSNNRELCSALLQLLQAYDPFPTFVIPALEEIFSSQKASEEVRRVATNQLIALKHPYGLVSLKADLQQSLSSLNERTADALYIATDENEDFYFHWFIEDTLRAVSIYGEEAKELGPLVTPFLSRRDLRDARAQAALTLGVMGYTDATEALLNLIGDFPDDWYLAYNSVESLGRLKVQSVRSTIEAVENNHWYKPVRNNALRAKTYLSGGNFARLDFPRDGEIPSDDQWPLTGAEFRYQGDISDTPTACATDAIKTYELNKPQRLTWPNENENSFELKLAAPTASEAQAVFSAYPELREYPGELEFSIEFGDRLIAGLDAGEFGGGVYALDKGGRTELLIPANAIAAFKTDEKLFVTTGLSHLAMSTGDLWVVELEGSAPVLRRRVRLPLEPTGYEIAYPKTLIVKGERGDVAIKSEGMLIDPLLVKNCKSEGNAADNGALTP